MLGAATSPSRTVPTWHSSGRLWYARRHRNLLGRIWQKPGRQSRMSEQSAERTYSDAEVEERLKKELPQWHLEGGWIRRKYKTASWKGTLMVINTVGHLAE